jgi:hypothetical protein
MVVDGNLSFLSFIVSAVCMIFCKVFDLSLLNKLSRCAMNPREHFSHPLSRRSNICSTAYHPIKRYPITKEILVVISSL